MSKRNHYDNAFRVQAVKLALEIGQSKASKALDLPENTIDDWMRAYDQETYSPGQVTPMTPGLKWAGGKSQLLPAIKSLLPAQYEHYYEPFIGGGSVLLSLIPQRATINDINRQLVNLYRQLQKSPEIIK